MKLQISTVALLFAVASTATPIADADSGAVPASLEKRGETCDILGNNVNCRSGPGTSYRVITTFDTERQIYFSCYKVGESISGNDAWDYSTGWGCYVSARYTGANCNKQTLPKC